MCKNDTSNPTKKWLQTRFQQYSEVKYLWTMQHVWNKKNNYHNTVFREEATWAFAADFLAGPPSGSNWNLECWLSLREGNHRTQRKTFGAWREPTTNSTHIWQQARIKRGTHWWKTNALTGVPSRLPIILLMNLHCRYLGKVSMCTSHRAFPASFFMEISKQRASQRNWQVLFSHFHQSRKSKPEALNSLSQQPALNTVLCPQVQMWKPSSETNKVISNMKSSTAIPTNAKFFERVSSPTCTFDNPRTFCKIYCRIPLIDYTLKNEGSNIYITVC